MTSKLFLLLLLFIGFWGNAANAKEVRGKSPVAVYDLLEAKAATINRQNSENGWGYLISGGLALGISLPGFYLSDDVFARGIYSVGQTLGVASIGYGSYLLLESDDYTRFGRILKSDPHLTPEDREILSTSFLIENAERARASRKIRVITHGMTAALNFVNAYTASQRELKTTLYFLGGINTLVAIGYGFSRSEEEKLSSLLRKPQLVLGPGAAGIQFHF